MNPRTGYATPDAGRNRPVSLGQLGDLPDAGPWPGDEFSDAELVAHAPEGAAMAGCILVALSEALNPVDRESLLYLLRPDEMSLRARARVASVSPATIRSRALRFRQALRDALNTTMAGDPHRERDSGDDAGFR